MLSGVRATRSSPGAVSRGTAIRIQRKWPARPEPARAFNSRKCTWYLVPGTRYRVRSSRPRRRRSLVVRMSAVRSFRFRRRELWASLRREDPLARMEILLTTPEAEAEADFGTGRASPLEVRTWYLVPGTRYELLDLADETLDLRGMPPHMHYMNAECIAEIHLRRKGRQRARAHAERAPIERGGVVDGRDEL